IERLDADRGEALFVGRCTSCHGPDGQGDGGGDKKPGPLGGPGARKDGGGGKKPGPVGGPESGNDGAGAARVYTLAGIIRYSMPYLDPGSLTDEEAQQVARFIPSKPRPPDPYKPTDYLTEKLPPDSVYYPRR